MFVTGLMMVLNEEEFLEWAWAVNRPQVDHIIVVEGGTELAVKAGMCGPNGKSTDATREILCRKLAKDNQFQLLLADKPWKNKANMWNACLPLLPIQTTHIVLLDADEIWNNAALRKMATNFNARGGEEGVVKRREWTGSSPWAEDLHRMEGDCFNWRVQRIYRWRKGRYFADPEQFKSPLILVNPGDYRCIPRISFRSEELIPDHYGYARNEERRQKRGEYYQLRGGW